MQSPEVEYGQPDLRRLLRAAERTGDLVSVADLVEWLAELPPAKREAVFILARSKE